MLTNLSTSLLLHAELAETVSAYLKTIENTVPDEPFLNRITQMLAEDLAQLKNAITAVRRNTLVDDLVESDAIRDDLFIGFRDTVDTFKRRRSAAMRDAYEKIWQVIEKAGTQLYRLGYTEQSGRLDALLEELDKPAYQEVMATINVTELYAEFKQAQADFSELHNRRLSADADINYPTLRDAKAQMVPHVNALLNAIGVLNETNPETFGPLVDRINAITAQVMTSARARKTRASDQPEDFSI